MNQSYSQKDYQTKDLLSAIEHGLIPAIQIKNAPVFYNLEDRMKHYNVPGFSITTIKQGKIESAKGFGFAKKNEKIEV